MTIDIPTLITKLRTEEEAMSEHSPLPWPAPEYSNDVGPCDEGFWEWWGIGDISRFDKKNDAVLCYQAVNFHAKLVAALETLHDVIVAEQEHGDSSDEDDCPVCNALRMANSLLVTILKAQP